MLVFDGTEKTYCSTNVYTSVYKTFTHFAVSQSVLQNRFTELRLSDIILMNHVDQSLGFKLSLNDRKTDRQKVQM